MIGLDLPVYLEHNEITSNSHMGLRLTVGEYMKLSVVRWPLNFNKCCENMNDALYSDGQRCITESLSTVNIQALEDVKREFITNSFVGRSTSETSEAHHESRASDREQILFSWKLLLTLPEKHCLCHSYLCCTVFICAIACILNIC